MTEVTCPAEGCDYTREVDSVLGHINAKSDEAHRDKQALREAVEALVADDGPNDQEDDHPETEGEQADDDPPETTPDEGGDGGGSTTMTDEDEVNDQWNSSDEGTETEGQQADDDGGDDPAKTTPSAAADGGGAGGGLPVPIDPTTLMLGVALLAVGVLVWQYAGTSGGDHPETEAGEADETTPSGGPDEGASGGGSGAGGGPLSDEEVTLID